ncbi:hypothetical protein [Stackebrandtia soli]|uniref:hypothetical protein n=1 Tax=Stackebrandtia soli TaxID=1892856 RepID=UPI0039E9F19F
MPIYDQHCPTAPTDRRAVHAGDSRRFTPAVSLPPNEATIDAPQSVGGAVHAGATRVDADPVRSLGLFKLGHRLIAITYVGEGKAVLDLLGTGGGVAFPVGTVTGIDTAVPLLFAHPTQRGWASEPANAWFLTRTTVDRHRATPVRTSITDGGPVPARPHGDSTAPDVDLPGYLTDGGHPFPPTDPDPTPAAGHPRAGRTGVSA